MCYNAYNFYNIYLCDIKVKSRNSTSKSVENKLSSGEKIVSKVRIKAVVRGFLTRIIVNFQMDCKHMAYLRVFRSHDL